MDINIKAIKFDATDKLQEFIQKKVSKLDKYCNDIRKVEVSLKVVKPETAMNKQASLTVTLPGTELFAEKICDTFEEAAQFSSELFNSIKWFDGRKQALEWFKTHDWEGDYSGRDENTKFFVELCIKYLEHEF